MSAIRTGTCGAAGPYAAHCTEEPGHRYSCYDAGEDVSFNEGMMRDTGLVHNCDDPNCVAVNELRERYPEVGVFVDSMYRELAANAHKGDQEGWRTMTLRQAWQEISWHAAKLAVAIKVNDEHGMREYAADVANGCMMLVDILNHGEMDRCRCGWLTTVPNPDCAWHEMRAAKGEVPASEGSES
jgi:hypothetical protein